MSSTSTDNIPVKTTSIAARRFVIAFSTILSLLVPCGIAWRLQAMMSAGGTDFASFYAAGAIIRSGNGSRLYNVETQRDAERVIPRRSQENQYLVFPHAPFESLPFALLAGLSYDKAVWVWWAINLTVPYIVLLVIRRQLPFVAARLDLALLALGFFYPLVVAQYDGQDSLFTLLFCALSFACFARKKFWAAGSYLGLAMCKPPLAIPIVLLLAVYARRRLSFLAGFLTMCSILLVASFAAVGWSGVISYPRFLSWFAASVNEQLAVRSMPNLRGLIFSIFGSHVAESSLVRIIQLTSILLLVLLGLLLLRARIQPREMPLVFSIAVTATVLVAYHEYAHDLALMFLPLLLVWNYAANCAAEGENNKVLVLTGTVLWIAPFLTLQSPQIYTGLIVLFLLVLCVRLYKTSIDTQVLPVNLNV